MLKTFSVENYKLHKEPYQMEIKNLNVFTGANNSGKSSMTQSMRAMLFWLKNNRGYNYLPLERVTPGCQLSDIINKQVSRKEHIVYDFSFDINTNESCRVNAAFASGNDMGCQMGARADFALLVRLQIFCRGRAYELCALEQGEDGLVRYEVYRIVQGKKEKCDFLLGFYGTTPQPDNNAGEEMNFLQQLFMQINYYFSRHDMLYLGPYRMPSFREKVPFGVGLEEHGGNAAELLGRYKNEQIYDGKRTLGQAFAEWSSRITHQDIQTRIRGDEYFFVSVEEGIEFPLEQIGFGNTQLLPMIVSVLLAQKGDILIIENPEVHLHPRWKTELVDLFYEAAQYGIQILLETQSIEIINRIRRRARERADYRQLTGLWFFEKDGFACNITKLDITENGDLSCWPEDFVDKVTLEDSFALI